MLLERNLHKEEKGRGRVKEVRRALHLRYKTLFMMLLTLGKTTRDSTETAQWEVTVMKASTQTERPERRTQ